MKKILLVEDDVLVAGLYRRKLADAGFDVLVAADGLEAMKLMPEFAPDLVVLDLMMPKLGGLDVLKFIRRHARLKSVRVVVFSSHFGNELWGELAAWGVQDMLLKPSVTPGQFVDAVVKALHQPPPAPAAQPADGGAEPAAPAAASAAPANAAEERSPDSFGPVPRRESAAAFRRRVRREFFEQIPVITRALEQSGADFLAAPPGANRARRLEDLRRKVGFVTHMTSMAACHRLAQLSGAFESLLFELQIQPEALSESARHTIDSTLRVLAQALGRAEQADEQCLSPTEILVVDDDSVSARALAVTLHRANFKATTLPDPLPALDQLRARAFDAVLLDINLPGMSGLALCEQMRRLPLHARTPVIFVTGYAEFEPQARAILSAGDDLISKPILPIELSVKIISHLLKRRLARAVPAG